MNQVVQTVYHPTKMRRLGLRILRKSRFFSLWTLRACARMSISTHLWLIVWEFCDNTCPKTGLPPFDLFQLTSKASKNNVGKRINTKSNADFLTAKQTTEKQANPKRHEPRKNFHILQIRKTKENLCL